VIAFTKPAVLRSTGDEFAGMLANEVKSPFEPLPVLTDDLAPVEYYNSIAQRYYRVEEVK
jgi:hypothetical protein